nr:hypothetical protein [Tanacetum cinerariifolium]
MAHASSEICLMINLEPNEWLKDSGCSKHMIGNQKLFSTYKAYNGGNVIFGSNIRSNIIGKGQICDNKCKVIFSEHDTEITKDEKVIESLNVTFVETLPPSKTSPLVDDDLDKDEAIKVTKKKNLVNDIENETLKVDEIVNIKETKNQPLGNVIGNLNQRTLRLFNHIMPNLPKLSYDHYILHDHVMYPLAPRYEQKTQGDHGTKISHHFALSSSSTPVNPTYSHPTLQMMKAKKEKALRENCDPAAKADLNNKIAYAKVNAKALKDITEILEFKTSRDRYGMSDSTGVSVSFGEISLEGNKSWESNIGDSDNTGDGGKIAGRLITTWGGRMVSCACMTYSFFESSCKGKKTSMSKRYLVKLFEESGEMLPGEAEK